MQILARGKYIMWISAVIVVVFVYLFLIHTREDQEEATLVTQKSEPVFLSTSTIPISVSGVVKATDRAIISAETGGTLTHFYVTEGSSVTAGSLLVSQATPVENATYVLRQAEAGLTSAQQAASIDAAQNALTQAEVIAYSTKEIADLSALSGDNRVQEASEGVLVSAEANVTALLDALQFVSDNKSLFGRDVTSIFREVVANLYGSIPNHFQRSLYRTVRSEIDLLGLIKEYAAAENVSAIDIQNLYTLLEAENAALLEIYSEGESDILDRKLIEPNSTMYEEYFAQRAAVIGARSDLVASNAVFSSALDGAATNLVNQDQSVAVSEIDEEFANRQSNFSKEIARAASRVAQAASNVVAAQQSLGELRAPFDGVVAKRFKDVGEYANPGEPLLQLEGVDGKEVAVSVPLVFASSLAEGQPFVVDGQTVGVIDRFSPIGSGNVVYVVIVLDQGVYSIGSTIAGVLLLSENIDIYEVPRSYVHFGSNGAFVEEEETKEVHSISIVYDAGSMLYVALMDTIPKKPLHPAYSIALP